MNQKLFVLLTMALSAVADGKVTGKEATEFFFKGLEMAGVPTSHMGRYDIFVEQDGDVHIIVKKELLDKLSFTIEP